VICVGVKDSKGQSKSKRARLTIVEDEEMEEN